MRTGGESVTHALLSAPRISAPALLRLLPDLIRRQNEAATFRVYVTDCLRLLGENTARWAGGSFIEKRYCDIIDPPPVDNRSCEEIMADVIARCGLEVK